MRVQRRHPEAEVHDFSEPKGYRRTRKYDVHPRKLRVVQCECGCRFKQQWLEHSTCDSCADRLNRAMGDASP